MALSQEALYVIECYRSHFLGKKNIVIYGIGVNTKAILSEIHDPNIVGLMDPQSEGSIVMGKPVFSVCEASQKADLIVIVARPAVVPIIFERVRHLESENHLPIYNIEGKRLIEQEETSFVSDLPYWNCTGEALKQKMAKADVISFDIFDTLITRDVLRPVDLFVLLERKLSSAGVICPSFAMKRQEVEAELNQCGVPNLEQIYAKLGEWYSWKKEVTRTACSMEFDMELQACHARKYMRNVFQDALKIGKTVILISDMYLPEAKMRALLMKNGYEGYQRLYISCEYQMTKASGALFALVRKDFAGTILHIGDNPASDDKMARINGYETYPIYSVYDMLLRSSMQKLVAKAQTPESMLTLGIVTRELFDDPFSLGPTRGVVYVDDLYQLGFVFIGPIVSYFMRWMCQQVWDTDYDMILFSARDGYLIEKLYQERRERSPQHLPKGIYFKTSRRAITVAALKEQSDFLEILQKPYRTTKGELLSVRFGIKPDSTDPDAMGSAISTKNPKEVQRYIEKYAIEILKNAKQERSGYLQYMNGIGVCQAKKILIYDFCSRGTIQYYLTKLLRKNVEICGLYFATMEWNRLACNKNADAFSMFGDVNQYHSLFATIQNYMFLEEVLLEGCTTYLYCKSNGMFEHEKEANQLRDTKKEAVIQDGICSFDACIRMWELQCNAINDSYCQFVDAILGMFFSLNCEYSEMIRGAVSVDNTYDFEHSHQVLK